MISRCLFISTFLFGIVLACQTGLSQDIVAKNADPMLVALNRLRPVMKVVRKHYPDASFLAHGKKLHFEDSTQLHLLPAVTKVPAGQEPPLVVARGPKKDGVWCDIILVHGDAGARARSEGSLKRGPFVEQTIYQDLAGTEYYLHATVRVKKNGRSAKFLKDFYKLIQSYSHDFMTDK